MIDLEPKEVSLGRSCIMVSAMPSGLCYLLCQFKMVLSVFERELQDVNRMGYPGRRPVSVNNLNITQKHHAYFFFIEYHTNFIEL